MAVRLKVNSSGLGLGSTPDGSAPCPSMGFDGYDIGMPARQRHRLAQIVKDLLLSWR